MNTFKFIGNIPKPRDKSNMIKSTSSGKRYLKVLVKQNQTNSAYTQLYGDDLINGDIPVYMNNSKGRNLISFEDRFDERTLSLISYASKCVIENGSERNEYIWKNDFMDAVYEMVMELPSNTIYKVEGEFVVTNYNGKVYNNFNIKSIKVANTERPELTLNLDLFYNYESLDESDKKNKFILNAYVEQYNYAHKRREYYPLEVQFITNRFNFKDITDVEIIRHRKKNMSPTQEEGFVQSKWNAQYIKGAQMILPPLETLPKDIQFEIEHAGRDIEEYMNNIVGEASEIISLTRPENTKTPEGRVYIPLKCTNNEFKSKIYNNTIKTENTLDRMAENDASQNPFN